MRALLCSLLFGLAACASAGPSAPAPGARTTLDIAGEDYVHLTLEIGAHEEGYIDAYFGPPEWKTAAEANPRTIAELKTFADALEARVREAAARETDALRLRRAHYLIAAVESARFRLDMIEGVRVPFRDEAERLFALRPDLEPLESYDPVLARLETIVPGEGPLAARVEAFRARFVIPPDRLGPVMDAAIAACRERTLAHLELPEGEAFRMSYVTNKSWSAYNYYEGNNQSRIEVNTDLPVTIDRAIGLGCHEGYPGHHVQGIYNERKYRELGWLEYSVAPLYTPASPLNEGGGNVGADLAFPPAERVAFEAGTLYPLAGLDPALADEYDAFRRALDALAGTRLTIAAMYLDGEISRERAIELTQRYQLVSEARASQLMDFNDGYRSYTINYYSGELLVRAYVERAGESQDARWAAFERYLTEPTLPSDLAP